MNAIHFGAGNIGRGFIGKLLADSKIHVTFADVNKEVVEQLKERQSYTVKIVGSEVKEEQVTNVTAVDSSSAEILDLIASVDMITTAVGPNVLKLIARTIADGIQLRFKQKNVTPLNIIACENMVKGTTFLKEEVMRYLPQEMHAQVEEYIGFPDSAVDRIVPPAEAGETDPLAVTVETFSEWIVDKTQFVGEIPNIAGMELTDNLMAFIERKLFTLNTGHLMTAYLGALAGYKTVREAIEDPEVRAQVKQAMQESGAVLIKRYSFDPEVHAAYIEKILGRFANPYLVDEIDRVGREPIRKLGPNDRLVKPLLGTMEYGLANETLLKGIAAAFFYINKHDPQAVELQTMFTQEGLPRTLANYSSLDADGNEAKIVVKIYNQLKHIS